MFCWEVKAICTSAICDTLHRREEDGEQKSSRIAWAVTSVIGIALSGVVSVTVPFFDIIVAVIGALGDLAAAYALPALFVLVGFRASRMTSVSVSCASPIAACCQCLCHFLI